MEATAEAYELAVRQEADNRNLKFPKEAKSHGHDDSGSKKVFLASYNKVWEENSGEDARTREAKSLEAGGKAVVRYLLDGSDITWKRQYANRTELNINKNLARFQEEGKSAGYENLRREVYTGIGKVSSRINLIPDEYLGPDAAKHIDKCFHAMGLQNNKPAQKHDKFSPE